MDLFSQILKSRAPEDGAKDSVGVRSLPVKDSPDSPVSSVAEGEPLLVKAPPAKDDASPVLASAGESEGTGRWSFGRFGWEVWLLNIGVVGNRWRESKIVDRLQMREKICPCGCGVLGF